MYIKSTFVYTKKGTNLERTIMIKNGILIKFSALEETFSGNDATISKENIGKSYTCYFNANLINGRVVRTKGMPKYQITAK